MLSTQSLKTVLEYVRKPHLFNRRDLFNLIELTNVLCRLPVAGLPSQGQLQVEAKCLPWAGTAVRTKLATSLPGYRCFLAGEGLGWAGVLLATPPTPKISGSTLPALPLLSNRHCSGFEPRQTLH